MTKELDIYYQNLYIQYLDLIKKIPKEFATIGFIELKKIILPSITNLHITKKNDKYINTFGFEYFKKSLLKNGTYWVFIVQKDVDIYFERLKSHDNPKKGLILHEGLHRYIAYSQLIDEGKLPNDFKILCIFFKKDISYRTDIQSDYIGQLFEICQTYKNYDIEKTIIPHPEINICGLYWNEIPDEILNNTTN